MHTFSAQAEIKCSICSYQCDNWYPLHWWGSSSH